ncbi:uncharacterized protein [Rutidosis leptorrhynchoides]|uniref:uncharacterized protein n=1 Tax=Rutidosis leptorrhynchoides TaxID=125765 RepID=UPI003A9A0C8F
MEGLSLTTTTTATNTSKFTFSIPCYKNPKFYRNLPFHHKKDKKFAIFAAAKDEDNFDSYDQMEIKFGRLIGEDPKLTLAKIIGRKTNPELSYLEIEKLYNKKGMKAFTDIEELPFDVSDIRRKPKDSLDGLNLTRPVPKKGVKFEPKDSLDGLNLTRPVPKKGVKFEPNDNKPVLPKVKRPIEPVAKAPNNPTPSVPNVKIRKPTTFKDDDGGFTATLQRPNLSFKLNNDDVAKERVTDMKMVRKPEPFMQKEETESLDDEKESPSEIQYQTDVALHQKPEITLDQDYKNDNELNSEIDDMKNTSRSVDFAFDVENVAKFDLEPSEENVDVLEIKEIGQEFDHITGPDPDIAATLRGPPKRLDQSLENTPKVEKKVTPPMTPIPDEDAIESEKSPTTLFLKEREDTDWKRAEDLIKTEGREEVELINSSTRGFVASFGSLIGFLPYRNLATKWKYLAFESWLRKNGLDPAMYRQSLGVIGGYNATSKSTTKSTADLKKIEGEISPDMKLEDLLAIYDQEKLKYLSSFVGQKVKVNVVLADKESNKLIFSGRPKEKDESVERKKNLMAKLSVGDVVKCCIKKITYYGIFVEVEGVPALIHQTEVSWDDTLDIISHFKIGQFVEAKVHQLDFSLERIFLSLKDVTPDPLIETLEGVVGDQAQLDGRLEEAQPEEEWAEVESLVKELELYEGIDLVKKGRFFKSPGLAPTFQVYMASVLENEYKLLARAENKVQEVIVQTSLGKEEMKSAILTCANKVE